MSLTCIFKVLLFASLVVFCSCIAGKSEPECHRQGDVGYLASQLILKFFSDLETDIQELKAEVADLKNQKDKPKTIFAQMQLFGDYTYQSKERIYFNSTVANVGNAYDIQHGYFEAPQDGTYLFIVTLCTNDNNYVEFRIVQDGNSIGEVISGDTTWITCASNTAVTDEKWLKSVD